MCHVGYLQGLYRDARSRVYKILQCIYHTFEAEFCCNFTVEMLCKLTLISVCEVIKIKRKFLLCFWRYLALGILSYNSFAYSRAVKRKCKHVSVPVLCSPSATTSYITRKKKGYLIFFSLSRLTYVFLFLFLCSCLPRNNDTGEWRYPRACCVSDCNISSHWNYHC